MSTFRVSASAEVEAAPADVYAVFADYHQKHPAILPKGFTLILESGGTGAGTVFRLETKALGSTRAYRMAVTEPEPGRLLMEAEIGGGVVTTFRVEPLGPRRASVTITSDFPRRPGILGGVEAALVRAVAGAQFRQELRNLAALLARG
ncbi:MAG TPA: SRPBCC family protein [Longimicrobium sp.]|nr:SRPBCC family protein [Longimicrobium sp.]